MDSSPGPSPEPDTTARRRSGRVVRAPSKFSPEPTQPAVAKRKRGDQDEDDVENDGLESDEEMSDDVDDDSDADHPAPRSRKPSQTNRARKPSSKKPKLNGTQPAGLESVTRIPSRPKKTVRIDPGEKGTGLFGTIQFPNTSHPISDRLQC